MKRFLSVVLVLVMCCLLLNSISIFASETEGKCGNDLIWNFRNGVLTISGTGKMINWTYSDPAPWKPLISSITTIVIEDGVTSIGRSAFRDGENIVDVKIPNSVESIGDSAFCFCKKLENIIIPESVTQISNYAFEYCYELRNISISKNVTSIGDNAFASCKKLTHIEVDEENRNYCDIDGILFNKEKTILMQYPASKAEEYYSVSNNVKNIYRYAFADCVNLVGVAILDGVTSIGEHAFSDCDNLKYVSIPGSVSRVGDYAFADSWKLENIVVDEKNVNYSSKNGVLFNKDKTILVKYPEGNPQTQYTVPDSVIILEDDAFGDCDILTSVKIGNNVEIIGDSFGACDSLVEVTLPASVKTIERSAFNACHELKEVYYAGSREQWSLINIGEGNDELICANIYYGVDSTAESVGGNKIYVILNGKEILFDQEPIIQDGRTLVPLRAIFEALGANVEWNQKTKTITSERNGIEIILAIGSNQMFVNGEIKTLNVAAQLINDRTMVPARAIAEAFGCTVSWDNDTRTVTIKE